MATVPVKHLHVALLLLCSCFHVDADISQKVGDVQFHNCWKMLWWGSTWCCSAAASCSDSCPAGLTHTVECSDWYGINWEQCIPDEAAPSETVCRSSVYGTSGSCSTSPSVPENCNAGDTELSLYQGCCVNAPPWGTDSPFGGCDSGANAGNEKKRWHRRCESQDACNLNKKTFEIWGSSSGDAAWRTHNGCDSSAGVTPNPQPCQWCKNSNSLSNGCWLPYYITGNDRCIAASASGSFTSSGGLSANSGSSAVELVSQCNDHSDCKGTNFCQKDTGMNIGFCQVS